MSDNLGAGQEIKVKSRQFTRAGRLCEDKQRRKEVPVRGKGGTAIILSDLRAVSDLSGLREESRASVVPCDPRLHFMACS